MPADPGADLRALRDRLEKIRRLQAERSAVAASARELLAKDSTWPRPRREVEAELQTAEVFDLPMLAEELALAEQGIANLEQELSYEDVPQRPNGTDASEDAAPAGA